MAEVVDAPALVVRVPLDRALPISSVEVVAGLGNSSSYGSLPFMRAVTRGSASTDSGTVRGLPPLVTLLTGWPSDLERGTAKAMRGTVTTSRTRSADSHFVRDADVLLDAEAHEYEPALLQPVEGRARL